MNSLLYDALMLGRNKEVENEEFLVATGKKEAASFRTAQECVNISNVISDGEFSVQLIIDTPGYLEIEVTCEDNFIIFEKKIITSDEFESGSYEFRFMVISDRLHNGKNYSSITFRTSTQTIVLPVNIDNKIRVRISDINPHSRLIRLERLYLDLKMDRLQLWDWSGESLGQLNDISAGDDEGLYLMLYKAQVHLSRNDDIHARNYIEYVGTQIPKMESKNYDLYCYFIYLASLYEDVPGVRNAFLKYENDESGSGVSPSPKGAFASGNNIMEMSAVQKVRWVYQYYPSWRILWILMYMDPEFRREKELVLSHMRRFFDEGQCISPSMYLEALIIFTEDPSLLTQAGQFELQVFNFAIKNDFITLKSSEVLAQRILKSLNSAYTDSNRRLAIQVLTGAYEKYFGSVILRALCSLLVSLDLRDVKYHTYFAKAIDHGMAEGKICDYYIYTMDMSEMRDIPAAVMDHFTENTERFYEYMAYLYANIIIYRYSDPDRYAQNISRIITFAEYQMMMGQNNRYLSVIYRQILETNLITPNMKDNLFDVLCTKELICENSRMHSVMVFHRELQTYQESMLRDSSAFIKIYSNDALILFQDYTGNMYYNVEYRVEQLLADKEYIDQCIKDARINKYMLIGDTLPLLRAYKTPVQILRFFTSGGVSGQFRHDYELDLINSMVSYYVRNSKDEEVYDELLKFLKFDLRPQTRGLLTGIMIKRGQTDRAYEEIAEHGLSDVDSAELAALAHSYIQMHTDARDDTLTDICEAGFMGSIYDEVIFDYLHKYYNGRMDVLIELYRTSNAYNKPSKQIEERILLKAIQTQTHPEIISTVFRRYYENDPDKQIIYEYMKYASDLYLLAIMKNDFTGNTLPDEVFFDCVEKELMKSTALDDDCIIAWLLKRMDAVMLSDRQIKTIQHRMKDLVRRGKMLEEFKYYRKYFELPSTLANNIIISAFSEDTDRVPVISFEISGSGHTVTGTEEMEEIFNFCYVKYFTLFYGEKVVFSMDGQTSAQVRYADMNIQHDASMYAALDDMIRLRQEKDTKGFDAAAKDMFIKERMIQIMFNL